MIFFQWHFLHPKGLQEQEKYDLLRVAWDRVKGRRAGSGESGSRGVWREWGLSFNCYVFCMLDKYVRWGHIQNNAFRMGNVFPKYFLFFIETTCVYIQLLLGIGKKYSRAWYLLSLRCLMGFVSLVKRIEEWMWKLSNNLPNDSGKQSLRPSLGVNKCDC